MYPTKSELWCIMDSVWLSISIGSSIVTNVPLWWEMLIMEEAMHVWGQEIYEILLNLPLSFPVNLNLL